MWDLIVSVHDHCLSFYFVIVNCPRHKAIYFSWLGPELFCLLLDPPSSTVGFLLLQCSSGVVRHPRDLQVSVTTRCFC